MVRKLKPGDLVIVTGTGDGDGELIRHHLIVGCIATVQLVDYAEGWVDVLGPSKNGGYEVPQSVSLAHIRLAAAPTTIPEIEEYLNE